MVRRKLTGKASKNFTLAIGACVLLSACATTQQLRFDRPDTTQVEFMKDRLDCVKQGQQPSYSAQIDGYGGSANGGIVVSCGIVASCMLAKGYNISKDGALAAPPEAVVRMVN